MFIFVYSTKYLGYYSNLNWNSDCKKVSMRINCRLETFFFCKALQFSFREFELKLDEWKQLRDLLADETVTKAVIKIKAERIVNWGGSLAARSTSLTHHANQRLLTTQQTTRWFIKSQVVQDASPMPSFSCIFWAGTIHWFFQTLLTPRRLEPDLIYSACLIVTLLIGQFVLLTVLAIVIQ